MIRLLNPVIRGWANYHRSIVAKKTFGAVDDWLWRKLWQWARRRHPTKTGRWVKERYFRTLGLRNWVFEADTGVRQKGGEAGSVRLFSAASVPIRRHRKILGEANPFDPAYEEYFEALMGLRKQDSSTDRRDLRTQWRNQGGECPRCHEKITRDTGWQSHRKVRKIDGGAAGASYRVLLHRHCHRQVYGVQRVAAS